jgi:hypothetical protein
MFSWLRLVFFFLFEMPNNKKAFETSKINMSQMENVDLEVCEQEAGIPRSRSNYIYT